MLSPTFKFSQFIDLLLVRLYELDHQRGDRFYNLNAIAESIKEDGVPQKWVFDAAKVLDSRGLATCMYSRGGAQAQITGEGRLYIEENRGTTEEIRKHPDNYYNVNVTGNNNQVGIQASQTMTIEKESGIATGILREMRSAVRDDETLSESKKVEASKYLDVVEEETKKSEPNRNILAAILEPLSKIASIAGKVATLIQIING